MQATITSKGQVTLPKPIRDRLHLKPGDKIDFMLEDDGCLRVAPVTASVTQLKGMLPKPEEPVTLEAMDEAIVRAAARRS
jgi:AbrB family looped-hinge helix DNA binding protein